MLELRRSGFSEDEIRSHGNELMQNSQQSTAKSLKEHFILERIAEEEKVEDRPEDYDAEIALIAQQSGENPRRVRAQLEKRNLMDTLAEPDHRAEGDRSDSRRCQVQGRALQARNDEFGSPR